MKSLYGKSNFPIRLHIANEGMISDKSIDGVIVMLPELEVIISRLRGFITYFYGGEIKNFARYSGITYHTIESFLSDVSPRIPTVEHILMFERAGLNKVWLFTGLDSVFADNPVGGELRRNFLDSLLDNLAVNTEILKQILKENSHVQISIPLEELVGNPKMLDIIAKRVAEVILTKQEPLLRF